MCNVRGETKKVQGAWEMGSNHDVYVQQVASTFHYKSQCSSRSLFTLLCHEKCEGAREMGMEIEMLGQGGAAGAEGASPERNRTPG